MDEPTFTDLEPRATGSSGDGYIWKYLYTIRPSEAIKFDSTDYIPVPDDWFTNATYTLQEKMQMLVVNLKFVLLQIEELVLELLISHIPMFPSWEMVKVLKQPL